MKAICYIENTQNTPFDFVYYYSKEKEEPENLAYEIISSRDELDLKKHLSEEILIIEVDKNCQIEIYCNYNPHHYFKYKLNSHIIHIYKNDDDTTDIFEKFKVKSVNLSELFSKAEEISLLSGKDENELLKENENKWNKLVVPQKSPSPILSPKLLRNGENNGYSRSTSPSFVNCERSSPFKSPIKYEKDDSFRIRMPLSVRPVNLDLTYD